VQEGLDLIIRMMREEDARARAPDCDLREKFMACAACGGLDGEALCFRKRGDIGGAGDACDVERGGEFFRKDGIVAALGTETVIEVDGDQIFATAGVQPVQQCDGVASAGDGDEVRIAGREFGGEGDGRERGRGAAHGFQWGARASSTRICASRANRTRILRAEIIP
jgi:hypothetical protein